MIRRILLATLLVTVALPAQAQEAPAQTVAVQPQHEWPFATSDLPPDPAYRFGRLDNGMRYVIRPNATPKGTALVQFWVDAGSLAETPEELGYAHFIEHMAFNGSTHVPEGDMIKLLEREGLAFGADTNATTNYDYTLYKLDLPRNDPALLDTALMLMRETASELSFNPEAIEREKGVVLSEKRVRDTYELRNYVDGMQFFYPGSRFVDRLPIGTVATLEGATSDKLRALYQRIYRPENTAVIVVGDFDPDVVEAAIKAHFASWAPAPVEPAVDAGPIPVDRKGETDVFVDPALAEQVTVSRHGPWIDHTDTLAFRQKNVRRQLGYGIINRRFQRIARQENPPFRSAALDTDDLFEAGRTTNLVVLAGDGEWQRALAAAEAEYRRALEFGFTEAEVAEQVANLRTALENNAAGAETRSNASFITGAITLLDEGQVPTTPDSALQRFKDHLPEITPQSVMEALREELVPLDDPLIRFEGRTAPVGGAAALRAAWDAGMAETLTANAGGTLAKWAYTDFGTPGTVVSDTHEPLLGVRLLTFSNGLKLSLKQTALQRDRISVELNIDGGEMLNTRDDPLATAMDNALPVGGLGKHSIDDLQTILAGSAVGFTFNSDAETFVFASQTTPRDLPLQLQLVTAAVSDPGFRPEGEAQYRRSIENFFASRDATAESALGNAAGGILSDDDPRFTLQPKDAYLSRTFAQLKSEISDRLAHGALELALVGDFDEQAAIDLVARTLGALPAREDQFRPYTDNRVRSFTADRSRRTVYHDGGANQAIVRMSWPTTDDADFDEELKLELLERVMRLELLETLREKLGQTYSPGVTATQSDVYPNYGVFTITAAVDTGQVEATRKAMLETVARLAAEPVGDDELLRARQPMLEAYDNALKTNSGWMNLVERAQRKPERIGRFMSGKQRLAALTAEDVRAAAAQYLAPDKALEIDALPRPAAGGS